MAGFPEKQNFALKLVKFTKNGAKTGFFEFIEKSGL